MVPIREMRGVASYLGEECMTRRCFDHFPAADKGCRAGAVGPTTLAAGSHPLAVVERSAGALASTSPPVHASVDALPRG
jgi:hypothetical protein